jgi:hypothetical protein
MKTISFRISDLIKRLEKIKEDYGDLRVDGGPYKVIIVETRDAKDESIVINRYIVLGDHY